MVTLNTRVIEEDDVIVIRGLEFPNVIVQAKTLDEAKIEFLKAFEYFLTVRAKIENEKYPLEQKETEHVLKMELVDND